MARTYGKIETRPVNLADCTKGDPACADIPDCGVNCRSCATWISGIPDTIYARLTAVPNAAGKTCPCAAGDYTLTRDYTAFVPTWKVADGTTTCSGAVTIVLFIRCQDGLPPTRFLFFALLSVADEGGCGGNSGQFLPCHIDGFGDFNFLDSTDILAGSWSWNEGLCGPSPCPDIDLGPKYVVEFSTAPF